ncbi:hypothetical protein WICPIJ_007921 [Wickerhamomyces pijperi]|uniref:YMC020W-like alpha/beta hydrolase domain-containing protein n=1 Tax=Wickerhamomyces pijperi TaxID=599730 RepID=A0A9P8PZB7_WICPI|nr:hypothetical protein WICPIJ_007921 [Wickerhamomyces pijperi]
MSNKPSDAADQQGQRGPRLSGKQSSASLNSKYSNERERTSSDERKPQNQTSDTRNSASPQPPSTQHSSDSWSIWPKRNNGSVVEENIDSKLASSAPQPPPQLISSQTTTNKPTDSTGNETGKRSEETKSTTRKSDGLLNQSSKWIPWNITSSNNSNSTTNTQVNTGTAQPKELQLDHVKEIAEDVSSSAHDIQNVPKSTRSTSWSFWNNSTEPGSESESNKFLISKSDAVLFETREINTTNSKNIDPNRNTNTNGNIPPSKKKKVDRKIPNKVVPLFDQSLPYNNMVNSIYNNFTSLKHNLGFTVTPPAHLYRHSSAPKNIKKVLIIGVHGFFPTRVLRPLIGEPTGTSLKFTMEAEKCIWKWAKRENVNIEVQKIALEKEGKVLDRVEFFYNVLEKWKEELKGVDYIYIAAHSQGCPVSIILLAKLIESGLIDATKVRISLLAMAGINNGPFYGVDQKLVIRAYSTIESDSLMELFQFQNFESPNSTLLLNSVKLLLQKNVKISFVGSINDQLVPLYSSHALHIRHPNIFRATYVDGDSNTPEFVTRAISIANHLHNVGLSDHGLIKEVSNALAGPLTGGGHSRIYNDPQVYDLALNFSLYTTNLGYDIPLYFKPYSIEQLGVNPYHLPWCMRGLLYEAKHHFRDGGKEIELLFKEFEEWKPESKVLKDMKYRLNGLKSKL